MVFNCIKSMRKFFHLTQKDLAALSGLSQNSISDIENFKSGCSISHALSIYNAFIKCILSSVDCFDVLNLPHLEDIFFFEEESFK